MITSFGFYDFAGVWGLVGLQFARLSSAGRSIRGWSSLGALWIEQIDDVLKAEAILVQQATELGLELNFFLQRAVAFQHL